MSSAPPPAIYPERMTNTIIASISFIATLAALFLLEATVKLETFNRAWLRKLKDKDRERAEALREYLPELPQIQSCCRIALLLSICVAVSGWTIWFGSAAALPGHLRWIVAAAMLLSGAVALEMTDLALTLRGTAILIRMAAGLYDLLRWPLAVVLMPLNAFARKLARTTDAEDSSQISAEDEILSLVEDDDDGSHQDNAASDTINDLESDEKRMLNGVMTLDKTLVHEVMTPRVDISAISEGCSIAEAKLAIAKSGHSRIPVYKDNIDSITGVLYAKDLLDERNFKPGQPLTALLHPPVFIPETKNVAELLNDFRRRRIHIAIVLDEYGGTAGVVTIEDVLEEIVGEIRDEYDREEHGADGLVPQADGTLLADARLTIWEVNQALDMELSEEDGYDTIGGYIMARLGRIPRTGEHVETEDFDIDIVSASPRSLKMVRLKKKAE